MSKANHRIEWTYEMDEKFARLWPNHKADWDGWADALGLDFAPNRSTLYRHAMALGVRSKRGARPYTDEEEAELRKLVDWFCRRHGRTLGSVARKIDALYQRERAELRRKSSC